MKKLLKFLNLVIYWTIILIPFAIGIAPAPANVFMGFLIAAYLVKRIISNEPVIQESGVNLILLIFFIITCISVFHSINLKDSLRGGIFRLLQFTFVLLAVAGEVKEKKHIRFIVFSVAAGLTMVSLDAIFQVFVGNSFIRTDYLPIINIGLVRATSSFKDSNTFGIYLSALAPLIIGLTLYFYKKGYKRPLFVLTSLLGLSAIYLTYSRPTLLAIYIILIFFAIVRKNKILIGALILLVLISPFIAPKAVKDWAKVVEYNPLRFMCNDDRIAAYRNSLNMIKAHPFIGLGANTYMKNYKNYKEFPEYRNVVTQDTMYAHNMYLQMTAELGLIGISIFLWLLFKIFSEAKFIYKLLREDSYLSIICLSLTACLIAFLVNGLTESSLYYSRVALVFWYIAGLMLALKKFSYESK